MRILCVIDSLGSGGAQRQLVELAKGFKEKGHDVSFLVYYEGFFFKNLLDEMLIPVVVINETNYLKRLFKMRKYIRKGNYDSVLSFLQTPNLICEVAGLPWRKWKLVVGERSADPAILKSFKRRFLRIMHLFSNYVVSNSHANNELLKKANPFLPLSKYHVVYNLLDSNTWKSADDYLGLEDGKLLLIVAASHDYLKNAKGLIEAVNLLSNEDKNKLKVFWYGNKKGDSSYEETILLIKKYSLENTIFLKSATKEIYHVYKRADIVGLFSFFEGLPNVVCEAMMVGKPVLSSNVSDVPLLLGKDSKLLFNPENHNEIKNALTYCLNLDKIELQAIGKKNRTVALDLFDKDRIVNDYLKLLKN